MITGDALYCQRDLCRTIIDAGGDYLFAVKANQHELLDHLATVFTLPPRDAVFQTAEQRDRHGDRQEVRQLTATAELAGYLDWPGHAQVCRRERTVTKRGTPPTTQVRYAITSLTDDAATLLALWRGHWGIENRLHYVRDVTGGEDASRVRTGSGPQVMAALRNTTLAILRHAGWSNMAAAHRHVAWTPGEPLRLLGMTS